ncbi:hypothetical protein [Glutamicibacter sp. FBE19]|uniref:hypothetical protein n=1 Tax=Glutamicibacter sp. FBE19 TaxID=2761534 RepID=UPI0018967FDA|nr:hypothetical protein [Glutamicibacter sp. FBE19]MBF6671589.1 hypothetical protein [Glutamicibacter sp. FBE19]
MDSSFNRFPDNFALPLGRLVLAFGELENLAAEHILVHSRHQLLPNGGWSRSGQQLDEALRPCDDSDAFQRLCDEIHELWTWRNLFIHGDWVFRTDGTAALSLRRHRKLDKQIGRAEFDIWPLITPARIDELLEDALGLASSLQTFTVQLMARINEPG